MFMLIHMSELVKQDIIDITTGSKIGRLCDFTVDSSTAIITNLVVIRRRTFFGIFKTGEDIIIPWKDVHMFGKDTILVNKCPEFIKKKKKNILSEMIGLFK